MTLERDRIVGADAKSLLDNKLLQDAFTAVADYIEGKAVSCDPDNKEQAQRIILSKQLLAGIKREIERMIETGMLAEVRLSELEQRKRFGIFKR
jgi:hypothetical protein